MIIFIFGYLMIGAIIAFYMSEELGAPALGAILGVCWPATILIALVYWMWNQLTK